MRGLTQDLLVPNFPRVLCSRVQGLRLSSTLGASAKNISVWAEWLCQSVRAVTAVRDTPVVDYSAAGLNATLKTCKATAAGAFLTCTKFETRSKSPEFSGIVVRARVNQYSTKAQSSFWSLMLNSRCSCHGRCPFSAP